MKGFHYLKDVTTLELRVPTCIGCGRCLEHREPQPEKACRDASRSTVPSFHCAPPE